MNGMLARKVRGDLRRHALQLAIVALAVAIGSFGMVATLGARAVLDREIAASFEASLPPDIVVTLAGKAAGAEVLVHGIGGVAQVEPRRVVRARAEVRPGDWQSVLLFGVRDFGHLEASVFHRLDGAWPPPAGAVLIERSSLPVAGNGTALHLRLPGRGLGDVAVAGIALDPGQAPGWQDNVIYLYAGLDTLDALAPGIGTEQLLVVLQPAERGAVTAKAAEISAALSAADIAGARVTTPPRAHPHADQMRTILAMLSGLAFIAVLLASLLIAALLATLLARHVREIGVMKALGASTGRVAGTYLAFAGIPVALGTTLGGLAGVPAARALVLFNTARLNIDPQDLSIPIGVLASSIGISLGAALIALGIRVALATGMTPRQAMADTPPLVSLHTVRRRWGAGDRRVALALRNLFRRPGRLAMTVTALALGGAILMTSMNVYDSLLAALDQIVAGREQDMSVVAARPRPAAALLDLAAVPGVSRVEAWGGVTFGVPAPGTDIASGRFLLLAPPLDSAAARPRLAAGRWPTAPGEVAVSGPLQAQEQRLALGARAELVNGAKRVSVTVTGQVEEIIPLAYTVPETVAALTGSPDLAGGLRVSAMPGQSAAVAAAIEDRAASAGITATILTFAQLRQVMADHFVPMLLLLLVASGGAIAVGALALGSGMALTVLERSREIAVIRAIGASPATIRAMLLLEAGAVGAVSAGLAGALSLLLAWILDRVIGAVGLHAEVPFTVSLPALAGWLAFSIALAGATALIAGRSATRPLVRAVLQRA
jgi:putative ABC transport system permease protein